MVEGLSGEIGGGWSNLIWVRGKSVSEVVAGGWWRLVVRVW